MLISLIVVPAIAVSTVLGIWAWGSSDNVAAGPLDGQLRGTYPTQPQAGWTLDADDVVRGSTFVLPDAIAHGYESPGFIDLGDILVTTAVDPDSKAGALVGIDSATGDVAWQTTDIGDRPVCADKAVDGLLPCIQGPGRGANDESLPSFLSLVRVADGEIDRQFPFDAEVNALVVRGTDLYSLGYRWMAKGTINNPFGSWQREFPTSTESGCTGSGDSHFFGANDDVVYYGSDIGATVVDAHTGLLLADRDLQGVQLFGVKGFAGRLCSDDDPTVGRVDIYDNAGSVLHEVDFDGRVVEPWLVADPGATPVIVESTAYDIDTGDRVWTAQGPAVSLQRVVGSVVLGHELVEGPNGYPVAGDSVGLDLATGAQLWTSRVEGVIALSDGERVFVRNDGRLTALNLTTGQEEWWLANPDFYLLSPAGAGFANTTKDTITYYPPTGGPAVAPGALQTSLPKDLEGGPITKCGKTPDVKPVEYRAENGGLVVKMEFTATCPGGDIIGSDRYRITVRDGESMIASGTFDFSADPLVLGAEGSSPTTVELTFGGGSIWRLPNTLGDGGSGGNGSDSSDEIVTAAEASGNELVDCADEGADSGPTTVDQPPQAPSTPKATVGGDAPCTDGEALAALRVQMDSDRPFVQSRLADRWVAQLSAKQPGLVAPEVDGQIVTWTPCEILRQHLRMRLQYPEVRLVWSDEWRTFDLRGWWVTFAGLTFPDAAAANGWCDQRKIAVTECFAKIVSNNRDSRGTTQYRR